MKWVKNADFGFDPEEKEKIINLFEKEVLAPLGDPEIFLRETSEWVPEKIRFLLLSYTSNWSELFKKIPGAFEKYREVMKKLKG